MVTAMGQKWLENSNGEAFRNKQEWEELLELVNKDKMVVQWKQVPANSGIPGMFDQQSLRSACAYAQSDQSLC